MSDDDALSRGRTLTPVERQDLRGVRNEGASTSGETDDAEFLYCRAMQGALLDAIQAKLEAEFLDGVNPTHVVADDTVEGFTGWWAADGETARRVERQDLLRRRIAAIPVTLAIGLVLLAGLLLPGCEAAPINRETIATGNAGVEVVMIATVEGFNVYRLTDGTKETIYFLLPGRGPLAQTSWETCVGKNCVPQRHSVTTVLP